MNEIAISRLARPGTPEHEFLERADREGNANGQVSIAEFDRLINARPRTRLSDFGVIQLRTELNALAPPRPAGVHVVNPGVGASLPSRFVVDQRFWSWFTNFDIYVGGRDVGDVKQRLNLKDVYEWRDAQGALVARAEKRLFSWGTKIDITDGEGRPLGMIRERVLDSLIGLGVRNRYEFVTPDPGAPGGERVVAYSEKTQFVTTDMDITSAATGQRGGRVERDWWGSWFSDQWNVTRHDDAIHPAFFVFTAAFKTLADKRRSSSSSSSSDSSGSSNSSKSP